MTMYDDAELLAVSLTRAATQETDDEPITMQVLERVLAWGNVDGALEVQRVTALVVALARHNSSAISALAWQRGVSVQEIVDEFERYKLEQHEDEREE